MGKWSEKHAVGNAAKGVHLLLPNRRFADRNRALATPASLRIDLHYAHLGIRERWTWTRFLKLAIRLNYTPCELASVICLNHAHLESCTKLNAFPGPACLLLTMLEAKVFPEAPDVIKDPFQFHDSPKGS